MKKLLLSLCFCASIGLMASCAAQQEEPQAPIGERADTTRQWQYHPELAETVALPTARQQEDPERQYFILSSDSARITESGAEAWITVRGPLANGCQRHEYFDSVSNGSTLYLTFWGSRPTDSNVVCTESTQGYDREIHIPNSGYSRFSLIQPDGRTKTYSVGTQAISQR